MHALTRYPLPDLAPRLVPPRLEQGTYTDGNGDKYAGEWRDNIKTGKVRVFPLVACTSVAGALLIGVQPSCLYLCAAPTVPNC